MRAQKGGIWEVYLHPQLPNKDWSKIPDPHQIEPSIFDDGFSKSYTLYKYALNIGSSDFGSEIRYSIEIQCEKKKLSFLVYSDPIGIYPTTDLGRVGYAQVKIDSGKISKYKYIGFKDSSGIAIWSPKVLTNAMLKGKRQVAFKIPSSIQADTVAKFALADLRDYVAKFKSLGYSLK